MIRRKSLLAMLRHLKFRLADLISKLFYSN